MQNVSVFPIFLELNFSFFPHVVYLHLSISYLVLLTLFAVAAIWNTSPSSLETRDLLCARVFSRAAAILKSEKTLGTSLCFVQARQKPVKPVILTMTTMG